MTYECVRYGPGTAGVVEDTDLLLGGSARWSLELGGWVDKVNTDPVDFVQKEGGNLVEEVLLPVLRCV